MRNKLVALLCIAAMSVSMVACGTTEKKEEATTEEKQTIRLAAGDPMKEELINAIKGDFEDKGYTLEVSVIEDPVASNNGIMEGSLEANFIQHNAYMTNYNENNDGDLVAVGDAIYYPCMGIYSNKIEKLDDLKDIYSCIKERRGLGLMIGLEFDRPVKDIVQTCLDNGLIVVMAGANVIRMLPPFITTEKDVDQAIAILDQAIEKNI